MAGKTAFRDKIPRDIIIPILRKLQRELGKCVDSFSTNALERIKEGCGPLYAHIPLDDIRFQSINLRKSGLIGTVNSSLATKIKTTNKEYQEYLNSPEWKMFAQNIRAAWGYRCVLCNHPDLKISVHHRTYKNIGREEKTDCVPLCTPCHKFADRRRKREANKGNGELFDDE